MGAVMDSNGNFYFSDTNSNKIRKLAAGATSTTTVLTTVSGPRGMCVDGNGNLYYADSNNNKIMMYDGTTTTVIAGGGSKLFSVFILLD